MDVGAWKSFPNFRTSVPSTHKIHDLISHKHTTMLVFLPKSIHVHIAEKEKDASILDFWVLLVGLTILPSLPSSEYVPYQFFPNLEFGFEMSLT